MAAAVRARQNEAVSTPSPAVLLIEDEPQMRRFLRPALESQGYRVLEAVTAAEGLVQAASYNPEIVLLDLGLPDGDGVDVARRLREWSSASIIVVSARGQESDKVAALDAGADDYLTKPFGVPELLARLRVAERHAARWRAEPGDAVFESQGLRVDLAARRVTRDGQEVHLTRLEYKLLATLVRYAGRVVTHRQLLKEVWGPSAVNENQYLRVYMTQLRHKIEADPARPSLLATEIGVGYRLCAEPLVSAPE
jgi:two-component system, OmpR family, KDP operon response regulator KdpE